MWYEGWPVLDDYPSTKKENMSDGGREHDLNQLRQEYKSAGSEDRRRINLAAEKIRKESGKVRSMRESLIQAHRRGDKQQIAGIQSWVESHKEYRNEQ